MPAISRLIFRIAPLQIKPRFLIAFLVQIMQQRRIRIPRHLFRQFVQPVEKRQQVGLRVRSRHHFDRVFQFNQRIQQSVFQGIFHKQILSFESLMTSVFNIRPWG
jgi:hypothetical protein